MSQTNKSSALDNERKQKIFASMALQKRNHHANIRNFIDVTPWMNGSIILSLLQDADGGREPMLAEIAKRGIEYVFVLNPTKQVSTMSKNEKKKDDKGFAGLSMTELKSLVQKHEQARLLTEEDKTIKIDSIRTSKCQSNGKFTSARKASSWTKKMRRL